MKSILKNTNPPGLLTREQSIVTPDSVSRKESDSIKNVTIPAHLAQKNFSEMTAFRFHRLQSNVVKNDLKEISSSDDDYRSALSQVLHNDFEFLQNASVEERVKILKNSHERKNSRHVSLNKTNEENKDLSADPYHIPNIFKKKNSVFSDSQESCNTGNS